MREKKKKESQRWKKTNPKRSQLAVVLKSTERGDDELIMAQVQKRTRTAE